VLTACACLGAVAQWGYGRLGWDLEAALLARYLPPGPPVPLWRVLVLGATLVLLGIPLSSLVLHFVLKKIGAATQPFSVTYRLSVCSGMAAVLFKLVPWVGYFLGLIGGIVVQYRAVRRLHGASPSQAAFALGVTTVVLLAVVLAGGYVGHHLFGSGA
jgi:hypothetical protein